MSLLTFLALMAPLLRLTQMQFIALVHDEWYKISGNYYRDLMTQTVMEDLKTTLPFVEMRNFPFRALSEDGILGFENDTRHWEGAVALGGCQVQREVSSVASRLSVPALYLSSEACDDFQADTVIIDDYPLDSQFNCLSWLLRRWLGVVFGGPRLLFQDDRRLGFRPASAMHECSPPRSHRALARHQLRLALRDRVLTIVTIHRPPFTFVPRLADGGVDEGKVSGFDFEMLHHLQERLGFSYRLVYSYDGNWGSRMANGTWNGMVGMVARKEADMGVAPFTVTLAREEAIDFTFPHFTDPAAFLTPAPSRVDRITAFLDPFGFEVWLAIAVSLVLLGPTMYLFTRIQKCQFTHPHSDSGGQGKGTSVLGYYWMLITALLQQGVVYPMSTATRVVFGGWIVGTMALSCAYTGVLISFLTVPRVAKGVDSLQELARQSELQWTFRRSSALENLFLNQDAKGVYRAIGAPFAESTEGLVTTDYEGVKQVLRGTHAFIKEKSYLEFATAEDAAVSGQCRLALATSHFFPANFGWVLPEGDPLKVLFDKEIIRMQETGLFDKWKQKFWPKIDRCKNRIPMSSTKLRLFDFLGAFMLLGTGSCLALGTAVVECCRRRTGRRERGGERGREGGSKGPLVLRSVNAE
ncbi:glutamate receptor ionotropic, delta-1-like [Penaeus chinensis]|uniref:glutamate receptor ionotropic, delta-1-like n=1 Tax=Penaeus chinensis TaxID=139456 RepID=UPI001FB6622C|nr:glutamate receptor ionotropic, delta-1-like [Penaeus chinensis]